jgi:hypothetical protein
MKIKKSFRKFEFLLENGSYSEMEISECGSPRTVCCRHTQELHNSH